MAQVKPTILVTGKAGYIGSHVALALNRAGYGIIVLANLEYGHQELVENSLKVESYQFHKCLLRMLFFLPPYPPSPRIQGGNVRRDFYCWGLGGGDV